MSDIIDRANDRADEILSDALADHYRRRSHHEGTDFCVSCGELIPQARRTANPHAIRCTDCQQDHERWERQWA